MSLRAKLIWPILISITAIFVATQAYTLYIAYQSAKQEMSEQTQVFIGDMSHSIKAALVAKNKQKAHTLLVELLRDPNVSLVKLYDQNNQPFAIFDLDGAFPPAPNHSELTRLDSLINAFSVRYLYVFEPIVYQGQVIGTIRVSLSEHAIMALKDAILQSGELFLIIWIIVAALFYISLERRVLRPLIELEHAMQDFADGHHMSGRVKKGSKDEVGRLMASFDIMTNRRQMKEQQLQQRLDTLEQQKTFSDAVTDAVQDALIVTDNEGRIIHCNVATHTIFKISAHNLNKYKICDLVKTKTPNELSQILSRGLECNDVRIQSDKKDQQLSLTSRRLTKHGYLLFVIQDITEIEEAMNRQRVAGRVFENSQDGLVVINDQGTITMVNPAITRFVGLEAEQLVGQPFIKSIRWRKLHSMMPNILESINNYGMWQGEVIEKDHNGRLIPMFAKVNRIVKGEDHNAYDMVIILTDLSSVKEMERLEYLAHHDELTGLANRSKFHIKLDKLLQQSSYLRDEFAVLYLDLDGFKGINDTYGHDAGDEVLRQVAGRMTYVTRHSDLIARLSGDEFAMIVNPAGQKAVTRIAEQLIEAVCEPIEYKGTLMKVGVSIGVKLVGAKEQDALRILKSADTAMYQAKKAGKGQAILMGCESQSAV
ncbi:diguanylate cyclase domain-containing protein [Vibrio alfacsensis]|uniref:diguanylate cyclase domain-containing protein n=1 Tax=Vibrio alfacsensis TaxID=1074311 RepID=UPI0040693516